MDLYEQYTIAGTYRLPADLSAPRTTARANIHSMFARRLREHEDVACFTDLDIKLLPRQANDPARLIRYEGQVFICIDAHITDQTLADLSVAKGSFLSIQIQRLTSLTCQVQPGHTYLMPYGSAVCARPTQPRIDLDLCGELSPAAMQALGQRSELLYKQASALARSGRYKAANALAKTVEEMAHELNNPSCLDGSRTDKT